METSHSELEAEAQALVKRFNHAKASYSSKLEWFSMCADDNGDCFVFETTEYIDRDGLSALRESGRTVRYIEAYSYKEDVKVQIHVPVQGGVQG